MNNPSYLSSPVFWALVRYPRLFTAAVVVAVYASTCPEVLAETLRPGGGHSYSGGGSSYSGGSSSSYSSSGGGGDGDAIVFLIWLCLEHPIIGIPLTVGIMLFVFFNKAKTDKESWDSAMAATPEDMELFAAGSVSRVSNLNGLRKLDPEFSQVLFEDFAYRLFAQAHQARANPAAMAALAPYLSPRARKQLKRRQPRDVPVSNVVIGAMHIHSVVIPDTARMRDGQPNRVQVTLKFEANLTAGTPDDLHTYYLRERWLLIRDATVQTEAPTGARSLHCPSCGAPYVASDQNRCAHCNQAVEGGTFDWSVSSIGLDHQEQRPPVLTQNVAEYGNDKATVFQPMYEQRFAKLHRDDPEVTRESLAARLRMIYTELNAGWTALDLTAVRPFVSDGLYNYLQYWIDAYRNQGLRNVLEGMHVKRTEVVKTIRDRHFDAVTLRIYATGRDYTVRQSDGRKVSGSRTNNRAYTEYWTLIRAAKVRGAPRLDHNCPNCGAPLNIGMAGSCEYCGAHLTAGEFDWVLSKIEQDDSYAG